jgi:hypothetical protein
LEWEEQRRSFALLEPHQERMALFAVDTGLRQGELESPRWTWEVQEPELGTSVFLIPEDSTKNGDERVLVLNDIARLLEAANPSCDQKRARVLRIVGQKSGNLSGKKAGIGQAAC